MAEKLKVVSTKRTCLAFPAQWEAHLDDGRMIYVRYRHGWLSVQVSARPTEDVFDAVGGPEIFSQEHAGPDEMTESTLIELTKDLIEWPGSFGARDIKVENADG